jgi:hypothetical protein
MKLRNLLPGLRISASLGSDVKKKKKKVDDDGTTDTRIRLRRFSPKSSSTVVLAGAWWLLWLRRSQRSGTKVIASHGFTVRRTIFRMLLFQERVKGCSARMEHYCVFADLHRPRADRALAMLCFQYPLH